MPNSRASVLHGEIEKLFNAFLLKKYPIGSVIISLNNQNPENYIGGKWELIPNDTFLASKGITAAGNVGGDNNAILVNHSHNNSVNTNEGTFKGAVNADSYSPTGGFRNIDHVDNTSYTGVSNHSIWTIGYRPQISVSISESGQDGTNKNMPKYLACYIFKRYA